MINMYLLFSEIKSENGNVNMIILEEANGRYSGVRGIIKLPKETDSNVMKLSWWVNSTSTP